MPGIVTVTVPAAGADLTTLAAVKAALGLATTAHDTRLNTLITQASAKIAAALHRTMGRQTVAETIRVACKAVLVLAHEPVAITGITVDGTALVSGEWEVDLKAGLLFRLSGTCRVPWHGVIVANYTTGWVLPGTVGSDLPADIEAECIGMVRSAYESDSRDLTVVSETQEGVGQVRFADLGAAGMVVNMTALGQYEVRV